MASSMFHRASSRRSFVAGLGLGSLAIGGAGRSRVRAQATPEGSPVAGGTRIVAHAMGETAVPIDPRRVVVLDGPPLDAAIALGVTPVGSTSAFADEPWPSYLGDATEGMANVGTITEPELEKIVALNPDLILSFKSRHEEIYPQLSEIAPTVFAEATAAGWRDAFQVFADGLNRLDKAPEITGKFDSRVAEIAGRFGEELGETTVSVVRFLDDMIRIYQNGSFIGTVLTAIGLPRPESQQIPDESWTELSKERLIDIDASAIFVTTYGDPATTDLVTIDEDPLWGTLSAVQNNRVYYVPDEYWMTAIGYLAADRVLDDISAYLLDGKAPEALPAG